MIISSFGRAVRIAAELAVSLEGASQTERVRESPFVLAKRLALDNADADRTGQTGAGTGAGTGAKERERERSYRLLRKG